MTYIGDAKHLTPEVVDASFPLQEPGGAAETIKGMLGVGRTEEAEHIFGNLQLVDQGTIESTADAILEREDFDPHNLDLLRALRLGLREGMRIGRQEGANVLKKVREENE